MEIVPELLVHLSTREPSKEREPVGLDILLPLSDATRSSFGWLRVSLQKLELVPGTSPSHPARCHKKNVLPQTKIKQGDMVALKIAVAVKNLYTI